MKKMINKSHIEGILYESTLEERESKSTAGAKYISGKLSIGTKTVFAPWHKIRLNRYKIRVLYLYYSIQLYTTQD